MRTVATVLVAALAGCGSSSSTPSQPPATSTPPAIADCAAGTRPVAPVGTCAPVGVTDAPTGFSRGDWGFQPVLPPPCTGASIAVLGASGCAPIDDCSVSFPPADAAVAVRAGGGTYADRPSLPVVATLADALARAPQEGTIAVDEGEFALPDTIDAPVRILGRCAAKTALRGGDFGVHVASAVHVSLASLALSGAPKVALLVDRHATVDLDRVYVHGDKGGANVGNGATLAIKDSVFEGPANPASSLAPIAGVYATYGGHVVLQGAEVRGYPIALYAESVGTTADVKRSVLHEERGDWAPEGLAMLGTFLGAIVTVEESHIESAAGRIAGVGAQRLDGTKDPTSPGDPPASLTVTSSTLVHAQLPRENGSAIDVLDGATVVLDRVSMRHASFVGIGASGSSVTVTNSVIQADDSPANQRAALGGLSGAKFALDGVAIVGTTGAAITLDGASSLEMKGSLLSGNREFAVNDATQFLGAAQALSIAAGGRANITDSAFVGNQGTALFAQGGTAELDGVVLTGTRSSGTGSLGAAVIAVDAAIAIRGSTLASNDRALAIRRGRALMRDGSVTDHKEAFRLEEVTLVQTADPVDDAVDAELVAARVAFARNTLLVSTKALTDE